MEFAWDDGKRQSALEVVQNEVGIRLACFLNRSCKHNLFVTMNSRVVMALVHCARRLLPGFFPLTENGDRWLPDSDTNRLFLGLMFNPNAWPDFRTRVRQPTSRGFIALVGFY